MKLRCGLKNNLPAEAAEGEPLVTTDTQEMYIGLGPGNGIKKISDVVVSETEPAVSERLKMWMEPVSGVMSAYVNGAWQQVSNQNNTDFGTF